MVKLFFKLINFFLKYKINNLPPLVVVLCLLWACHTCWKNCKPYHGIRGGIHSHHFSLYILRGKFSYFLGVNIFIILTMSLLWTNDFDASLSGLQKSLSFLVIPVVFFIIPKISKETQNWIFRVYSFGILVYATIYIIMAGINYYSTMNRELFFNKYLVPEDPGTIYMSVFASFALFYLLYWLYVLYWLVCCCKFIIQYH